MHVGAEEMTIRNYDPDCLIILGRVDNMCRFCGEAVMDECIKKCGRCLNALTARKNARSVIGKSCSIN